MAKISETRMYSGVSPDQCFAVESVAFEKAGFQVWKKRDIAWLVQALREENGKRIEANLSARPGGKTAVTLVINCDGLAEVDLKPLMEKVFTAFEAAIQ